METLSERFFFIRMVTTSIAWEKNEANKEALQKVINKMSWKILSNNSGSEVKNEKGVFRSHYTHIKFNEITPISKLVSGGF